MKTEKLLILYGSQTGTAQDIAEKLWREIKRKNVPCPVLPMDNYDINKLIYENIVIFICSTTGQGEEPDNMKRFWKFLLRKNLPSDSLCNLSFTVLGLGDSSYIKFNFVAKRLHKRLLQLGGSTLLPIALADDQHDLGIDAVIDPWFENIWNQLYNIFPSFRSTSSHVLSNIYPRWKINIIGNGNSEVLSSIFYDNLNVTERSSLDNIIKTTVKCNKRTTAEDHFQDVRLIKFYKTGVEYSPGDVLMIRPKNLKEQIDEFFEVLHDNNVNILRNTLINLSEIDSDMPVPSVLNRTLSLEQLCTEYWDLSAIPRRYTFSILGEITTSELEKEKCREFTSPEGQNELYNYCNRPRRNIVEVLRDFPHATSQLNVNILFELLTTIKPRAFSIASSAKAHLNEIHVLVAVVKYKTKLKKERLGLCSNWMAGLKENDIVHVWLKKGSFRFPQTDTSPIIMVGPGTGVAPFRSFICEKNYLNEARSDTLLLVFGCRNKKGDFHFEDEFLRLEEEKCISLICAFSRDQENKIYVQHKIEENSKLVWQWLSEKNACIFLAGNSKNMPMNVREAFIEVCKMEGKLTVDKATSFIDSLEKSGKYQSETWA